MKRLSPSPPDVYPVGRVIRRAGRDGRERERGRRTGEREREEREKGGGDGIRFHHSIWLLHYALPTGFLPFDPLALAIQRRDLSHFLPVCDKGWKKLLVPGYPHMIASSLKDPDMASPPKKKSCAENGGGRRR